jgi:predicted ThiF/HesA family dinucleotide-utilizing enzyme
MNTKYIKAGNFVEIAITTDRTGRTSIVVHDNPRLYNKTIIDVELPCRTGEYQYSFKPIVKVDKSKVDVEGLKE